MLNYGSQDTSLFLLKRTEFDPGTIAQYFESSSTKLLLSKLGQGVNTKVNPMELVI